MLPVFNLPFLFSWRYSIAIWNICCISLEDTMDANKTSTITSNVSDKYAILTITLKLRSVGLWTTFKYDLKCIHRGPRAQAECFALSWLTGQLGAHVLHEPANQRGGGKHARAHGFQWSRCYVACPPSYRQLITVQPHCLAHVLNRVTALLPTMPSWQQLGALPVKKRICYSSMPKLRVSSIWKSLGRVSFGSKSLGLIFW